MIIANYGLKLSFATFLDAVGITCGISNCTFCTTTKSFSRFEISIGNVGHLFAPWNTTWHCFYPINPKGRAQIAGIVNKVYSIPIILNLLPNGKIALIHNSVSIYQQNSKELCTVRELPTQTTTPLFSTLMFADFHNQSPLLTMLKLNTQKKKGFF